jgi:hypothetical protein
MKMVELNKGVIPDINLAWYTVLSQLSIVEVRYHTCLCFPRVLAQFSSHLAYYIPHVFMVSFTTQVMNESLVRGSYIMTFMGIAEAISR